MPGRKLGYSGGKQSGQAYYELRRRERNSELSQIKKGHPGLHIQNILRLPAQNRKTQTLRGRMIDNLLKNPGGVNATRVFPIPQEEEMYVG